MQSQVHEDSSSEDEAIYTSKVSRLKRKRESKLIHSRTTANKKKAVPESTENKSVFKSRIVSGYLTKPKDVKAKGDCQWAGRSSQECDVINIEDSDLEDDNDERSAPPPLKRDVTEPLLDEAALLKKTASCLHKSQSKAAVALKSLQALDNSSLPIPSTSRLSEDNTPPNGRSRSEFGFLRPCACGHCAEDHRSRTPDSEDGEGYSYALGKATFNGAMVAGGSRKKMTVKFLRDSVDVFRVECCDTDSFAKILAGLARRLSPPVDKEDIHATLGGRAIRGVDTPLLLSLKVTDFIDFYVRIRPDVLLQDDLPSTSSSNCTQSSSGVEPQPANQQPPLILPPQDQITLKFNCDLRMFRKTLTVSQTCSFEQIRLALAQACGVGVSVIRGFFFDGEPLGWDATPGAADIEDGDCVDVVAKL